MPQDQDKITAVRLRYEDGQYGPQIPVGAKAENIQYDNLYSVKEVLGNVKTNVAPLQEQIDNIQTTAIGAAVDAWMDENATPATELILDSSLTQENQAAQAKAAGKIITVNNQTNASSTKLHLNTTNDVVNVALMDDIPDTTDLIRRVDRLEQNTYYIRNRSVAPWFQGRLKESDPNGGENVSSDNRCRCNSIIFGSLTDSIECTVESGYKYALFEYDQSYAYTGRFIWVTQEGTSTLEVTPNYRYRFLIAYSDNSNITPNDVPENVLTISYYDRATEYEVNNINKIINLDKFQSITYSVAGDGYVSASTGSIAITNTTAAHTDYIDISSYSRIFYSRYRVSGSVASSGMAFYDSEKTFISGRFAKQNQDEQAYSTPLDFIDVPTNAKYARFSVYRTSSAGTFYLYGTPKILGELEQKNNFSIKRNNLDLVSDFITVARSYLGKGLVYGYNSILQTDSETNQIDCSSFVGLCLRGYAYEDTSYATHNWVSQDAWVANSKYSWAINPYDYQAPRTAEIPLESSPVNSKVRTAAQLAQWMVERGQAIPIDEHLANIEVGDILFYARQNSSTNEWIDPDRYMHINHCAICISKEFAPNSDSWNIEKYPYKHELIDSRTRTGSIGIEIVEDGQNDPTNIYTNNINTLVLVCRPDLGAKAMGDNLTGEFSGETVTIKSSLKNLPVKKISTDFIFSRSGEGDPSPSNVRPILGYSECTVTNTGENSQQNSLTLNWQDRVSIIYGGKVTFYDDGRAAVRRDYETFTVSSHTFAKIENNNYRNFIAYFNTSDGSPKYDANNPTVWSSHYKEGCLNSGTSPSGDNYIWMYNSGSSTMIAIKDTSKSNLTAAQFKSTITDIKIIYKLNTPVTRYYDNIGQLLLYQGENIISSTFENVQVTSSSSIKALNTYIDYNFDRTKAAIEASRMGLHEIPKCQGAINIIRRARQLTDIKWTSPVALSRHMLTGGQRWTSTFAPNVEYTGIPYGETYSSITPQTAQHGYKRFAVGLEISPDTFVTAISCKDSIIAKENIGDAELHRSIMYATACDSLVCYALNIPFKTAANLPSYGDLKLIKKVVDNNDRIDPTEIQLCDVLQKPSHVAIITDIIKDNNGRVTHIEVSEETSVGEAIIGTMGAQEGGLARRRGFDLEYFYSYWGAYNIYRFNYYSLIQVPYTPSAYVNTGGEFNILRNDRLPCLPYEGDKFRFKTGYIPNNAIKILIEANGYNYLRVFKGDNEITGSPFIVGENDEYINIEEISEGDYSAYLCNISDSAETISTMKCYWSVVSAS